MTFKSAMWSRIVLVLSALNMGGLGFAAAQSEPWHAAAHGALALGFWWWAERLRRGAPVASELPARLEALELEVSDLRQELSETQERLDFTERVLAQPPETRRLDLDR